MGTLFEEYLTSRGTLVKPYSWLNASPDCVYCPYHIRTGEEARIPVAEFYQVFGFLPGPMGPPTRHLTFYELKTSSGHLLQKGQASSCTSCGGHPEELLFEAGGYLDWALHWDGGISHIVLYSSLNPCNEADHHCISKMCAFLEQHPDVVLSVHLARLYHTQSPWPTAAWNREALRSLASLWPRVGVSPVGGGLWHSLLVHFVSEVPGSAAWQPVLARRAQVDKQLAEDLYDIMGPQSEGSDTRADPGYFWAFPATRGSVQSTMAPDPRVPVIFVLVPLRDLLPIQVDPISLRPRNVVRHLNMPQLPFVESRDYANSLETEEEEILGPK